MAHVDTSSTPARPSPLDHMGSAGRIRWWSGIGAACAALAALGWLAFQGASGGERMFSPGPVHASHRLWANDCGACHAPSNGDGGFVKSVSDAACLKCHEAPLHHANQLRLTALGKIDDQQFPIPRQKPNSEQVVVSSQCATCHVEHRGTPALAATADEYCLTCHRDLRPESKNEPRISNSITAFVSGNHPGFHPPFGSRLRDPPGSTGPRLDRRHIRFNHSHSEHQMDCRKCHSPYASGSTGQATVTDAAESDTLGDGRYMRPINYERHCMECHRLSLPLDNLPRPAHVDMEPLRSQIRSLPQWLASEIATSPERRKELMPQKGGGRGAKVATKPMTQSVWVAKQLKSLAEVIREKTDTLFGRDNLDPILQGAKSEYDKLEAVLSEGSTEETSHYVDADRVEFYLAYISEQSCSKCHDMTGTVPALVQPATSPAEEPVPATQATNGFLRTVPTGITTTARRWFPASRFDHRAHRHLTCLDCHVGVQESKATADVLMPDLTTSVGRGKSCTDCHRPDTSASSTAGASCVTCHDYHNHAAERYPAGRPKPPKTVNAATEPTELTEPPPVDDGSQ